MVRQMRAGARVVAVVIALSGTVLAGCSDGPNPFQAASSTTIPTDGTSTDGIGENEFIPDRDLSDCIGALQRPNCGSKEKGGLGTYLVFLALILGVGFIMWRIVRGVKARDAVVNAAAGSTAAPTSDAPSDPAPSDPAPSDQPPA